MAAPNDTPKHTPGPCRAEDNAILDSAGRTLGWAWAETSQDEDRANAVLWAASPDLLTQLTGLLAATRLVIDAVDIDPEITNIDFRANGQPIAKVMLSTLLANADAAIRLAHTGERA